MSNYRNMERHTPRPTEYAGVRFRSKSEAVFARCLDLAGHKWQYEPGLIAGHQWDFLIDRKYSHGRFHSEKSRDRFVFIEYKPSEPTMAYVDSIIERMRRCPVESLLVWGSPWKPGGFPSKGDCYVTYPLYSHDAKHGWGTFMSVADSGEDDRPVSHRHQTADTLFLNSHADDASNYRFDLKANRRNWPIGFDFDPKINLGFSNKDEVERHKRLRDVAEKVVADIGLFKVNELYDDKGMLQVTWRYSPTYYSMMTVEHYWESIGLEPRDSVYHFEMDGSCVDR
jgi:hypothetical protein